MVEPPLPVVTPGQNAARFDAVVVPEIPVMWRAACAICANHADAEDLMQDALLRAFRFLDGFDGDHPRAWLLTIVRNTHRNTGRRRRPSLFASGEIPESLDARSSQPSAEDELAARDLDARVHAAVRSLSPKLGQVIVLVDVAGFTYDEAAATLGIPAGTVMSRLHRARQQIRSRLDRYADLGGTRS